MVGTQIEYEKETIKSPLWISRLSYWVKLWTDIQNILKYLREIKQIRRISKA